MFEMFKQVFAAIAKLFSAVEKAASSLDHLAGWCDETAGSFADEARTDRKAKSKIAEAQLKITATK